MILYLLKMSLCSAVLLLFYRLFLEKEKMLGFNRFYLLGSLVVSLVLPLVPVEILLVERLFTPPPVTEAMTEVGVPATFAVKLFPEPTLPAEISWLWLAGVLYLAVSAGLLLQFGKNLFTILRRIRSYEITEDQGIKLVLLDNPTVPHSFLRYVFVSKTDFLNRSLESEILDHERTHVRQRHTLDVLFVELLKVAFWINPVFYLYRNAIALNHEFLADEAVTRHLPDHAAYQHLLLRKSAISANLPFTSKFNYSFTKKRFVMMNKQTSRLRAIVAQGAVLPLLLIVFLAFSDLSLAQIAPPPPPVERAPPPPPVEMSSSTGLLPKFVKEYNALIDKYSSKPKNGYVSLSHPSLTDGKRLIRLREAMSKEQSDTLRFRIYNAKPSPKIPLSDGDFEKYKNPNVYGVWVDGKKVANTALDGYKAGDLIQIFVSRVYPNAQPKTGYKYKYQVDLMTEPHYDAYRKEYLAKPHFRLVRRDMPKQ